MGSWLASTGLTTCDASHCVLEICDSIPEVRLHRRKIMSASSCDCMYRTFSIWHRVVAVDTALDKTGSAVMHSALTPLIIVIKLTVIVIKITLTVIKLTLIVIKFILT